MSEITEWEQRWGCGHVKNRRGTKGKERDGLGEKKNRHENFKKKTNHVGIIR